MSAESTGEKEERDLEYYRETFDEEVEWPFLEPIEFALTVSATLDHRPARITQVPVQPLLAQHGGECSEQGQQKARVHQTGDSDDLARWAFLDRWDGGGLTGDGGLVEGEENGTEEGRRLLVGIGSEARVDIDDEG